MGSERDRYMRRYGTQRGTQNTMVKEQTEDTYEAYTQLCVRSTKNTVVKEQTECYTYEANTLLCVRGSGRTRSHRGRRGADALKARHVKRYGSWEENDAIATEQAPSKRKAIGGRILQRVAKCENTLILRGANPLDIVARRCEVMTANKQDNEALERISKETEAREKRAVHAAFEEHRQHKLTEKRMTYDMILNAQDDEELKRVSEETEDRNKRAVRTARWAQFSREFP